jgi:hypothetical protein
VTPQIALNTPPELLGEIRAWRTRFLALGIVMLLVCIAGAFFSPEQFFRSYLWSYIFYIGLTMGCIAWLMLQYLTGGSWGIMVLRLCESAARTLPLMVVLFVPIAIGIPRLYTWSHAGLVAADANLKHKSAYLNVPFFLGRAAIYFIGWGLLAYFLNRWSREQNGDGASPAYRRLRVISGAGLLFYGYSVTFMSIDWVMSADPHWFSTMFGMLFMTGQALSAMAFLITALVLLSNRRPFADVVTPRHLHDLGKLLLAFVMMWAYLSFSQFLIIWAGNLPDEIPFYVERLRGGWQYVGLALVFAHFALPFALLLSRDIKRSFRLLTGVAVSILAMRYVDLFWLVAPDYRKGAFGVSWMDFLLPVALGGLWLAAFAWQLTRRPLLPVEDLRLEGAIESGRE